MSMGQWRASVSAVCFLAICVPHTCCRTARDSDYCGWKQQRLISEAVSTGWAAVCPVSISILLCDVQIGKQPVQRTFY